MSGQSDQQPNNDVMSGTHNWSIKFLVYVIVIIFCLCNAKMELAYVI